MRAFQPVTAVCVLALCILLCQAQDEEDFLVFDCRVPTADNSDLCLNGGTCDMETGKCDCTMANDLYAGSTEIQCKYETNDECETNTCGEGTCYVQSVGGNACSCNEGYVEQGEGEECIRRDRVDECTDDSLNFIIEPYGDFNGIIYPYVEGKGVFTDSTCGFSAYSRQRYRYDLGENCGGAIEAVEEGNKEIRSVTVVVQYNPDAASKYDRRFPFKCDKAGGGGSVSFTSNSINVEERDPALDIPTVRTKAGQYDVGLEIEVFPELQRVGEPVTISVSLRTNDELKGFHIASIQIQDGEEDPEVTVPLVDAGCALKSGRPYITEFTVADRGNTKSASLGMDAIKFVGISTVNYKVDTFLCAEDDCSDLTDSPPPENCDGAEYIGVVSGRINDLSGGRGDPQSGPIGKRRKRQASNAKRLNFTVSNYIVGPQELSYLTGRKTQLVPSSQECMRDLVFILPLVILSVMLIISVMIAVYFCLKVSRGRTYIDEVGHQNMAYK